MPHEADVELAGTLHNLDDATNYADWIHSLVAPHLVSGSSRSAPGTAA